MALRARLKAAIQKIPVLRRVIPPSPKGAEFPATDRRGDAQGATVDPVPRESAESPTAVNQKTVSPPQAGAGEVGTPSARPTGERSTENPSVEISTQAVASGPGKTELEEEKIRKHREKTKKGLLKHIEAQGGSISLSDLHDHSERRYFVAHRAFSTVMEEFVDQQLVHWDPQAGIVTLTEEGRSQISG